MEDEYNTIFLCVDLADFMTLNVSTLAADRKDPISAIGYNSQEIPSTVGPHKLFPKYSS